MKYEKFEEEYREEISNLRGLHFKRVEVPEFKVPGYKFIFNKAVSFAFAVPAFAAVFAVFFYSQNVDPNMKDLSLLEESNNRILNQIDTLDYEDNI